MPPCKLCGKTIPFNGTLMFGHIAEHKNEAKKMKMTYKEYIEYCKHRRR